MLIERAEISNGSVCDVRIDAGIITAIGEDVTARPGEESIDARGGALIPGLHDHHVHLHAAAAALDSVRVGPPDVRSRAELGHRLGSATPGSDGWIRGVGYHESVAGELTTTLLDAMRLDVPTRIQHRTGAQWVLNSAGLRILGSVETGDGILGSVETGDGILWRRDGVVAEALGSVHPDLTRLGSILSSFGVTGVTDATPEISASTLEHLGHSVRSGHFPQRLCSMAPLGAHPVDGITLGPIKRILDDATLPHFDDFCNWIDRAHRAERCIAVHAVTATQLVLTLTALETVGSRRGDRIEHAAVVHPDLMDQLRSTGVIVVTQPGFVAERGDQYLSDVDAHEQPDLWRLKSLQDAGIDVGGSTDTPYTEPDPWASMRAAVARRTPSGAIVGIGEALSATAALNLYLGYLDDPARLRQVTVGAVADLCLLDAPLATVLSDLDPRRVVSTIVGGRIVYLRNR